MVSFLWEDRKQRLFKSTDHIPQILCKNGLTEGFKDRTCKRSIKCMKRTRREKIAGKFGMSDSADQTPKKCRAEW